MSSSAQNSQQTPDPEVLSVLEVTGSPNKLRKRIVSAAVILGLAAGGYFGYQKYAAAQEEAAKPVYQTAQASRATIQVTISATGTLQGLNTVEVGSEVSGKITDVKVDFNDSVTAGQLLAEIDPEQLLASVEQDTAQVVSADSSIRQARATLTEAKQKSERAKEQFKAGLLSAQDLEAAEAATARAEAALASANASATVARAGLKASKTKLTRSKIVSPIDGMVLARLVEAGQTVNAGMQTPVLFKITQDLRRMTLSVYIDEADIGRAKEGQDATFTVDAYPNRTFKSKVLSLRNEPKTDQNVVSYEAILEVDNSDMALRPGMTATATIVAERHENVLVVPNAALRFSPTSAAAKAPAGPKPQVNAATLAGGGRAPRQRPQVAGGGERSAGAPRMQRVHIVQGDELVEVPVRVGSTDGQNTEVRSDAITEGMEVVVDVEVKKK